MAEDTFRRQEMGGTEIRVGELARRTGLTVRTLHHWEEVGLLAPSRRTSSGHRLYGGEAIGRILRIRTLRGLGLGLEEIREALTSGTGTLEGVLRAQKEQIESQMSLLRKLGDRLDRILQRLDDGKEMEDEELLQTMEVMTKIERHFTAEQLAALAAREKVLGADAIREAELEWPRLIARVREEMRKGTDPASAEGQELARRWGALVEAFSGGDKAIEASLGNMYRDNPDIAAGQGLDPEIFQYIGRAFKAGFRSSQAPAE